MNDQIFVSNCQSPIADDQSNILPSCTRVKPSDFLNSNEYTRYLFCCFKTKFYDNLIFYNLPNLLKIYSASPIYQKKKISHPHGQMYFYFNAEDASNNGIIHDFTIKKDIDVISLDRISNIKILLASALNDQMSEVFNAINTNFQLKKLDKKTSIVRYNDQKSDQLILNYLCSLGFNGFAFKPLNNNPGELHLCYSNEVLSNGQYSKYNDFFITSFDQLI